MAIDARLRIDLSRKSFESDEAYHDAQHLELLEQAYALGAQLNKDVVRVEVEYPSDLKNGTWNISGDALEINNRTKAVSTLAPYADAAP